MKEMRIEGTLKRNDTPDGTEEQLLEAGWTRLEDEYEYMIRAILGLIRSEMNRMYWNDNQKVMNSPFDNTGASFSNGYVTVRAYNWDDNDLPNFDTDKLKVFWYKYSTRGIEALIPPNANVDKILVEVLNNTIESLAETFGENRGCL